MTSNINNVNEEDIDYINNKWVIDLDNDVQGWSASDASTFLSFLKASKNGNRKYSKAASSH